MYSSTVRLRFCTEEVEIQGIALSMVIFTTTSASKRSKGSSRNHSHSYRQSQLHVHVVTPHTPLAISMDPVCEEGACNVVPHVNTPTRLEETTFAIWCQTHTHLASNGVYCWHLDAVYPDEVVKVMFT